MSLLSACVCRNKVDPSADDEFDVSKVLAKLGYTKSQAEKRVSIYKLAGKGGSLLYRVKSEEIIELVVAGSRGEGLGIYFDTDVDKLYIQRSVKCYEYPQDNPTSNDDKIDLCFDKECVPYGYTKLLLNDQRPKQVPGNIERRIREALLNQNGKLYLQNDKILTHALSRKLIWENNGWLSRHLKLGDEKGPSKPYVVKLPYTTTSFSLDNVLAFPCSCPGLVTKWVQRERDNGWPTQELIERIEQLDVLVVPVGVKGHEEENLQWRISFSLAELEFVRSFNDTQIKVLALLKMLAKSQLKVLCNKITSYVMKNVFFWMLEESGVQEDRSENITRVLKEALDYLRKCIASRCIPNYMIPERNHYVEISEDQRRRLLKRLHKLIGDPNVALKCSGIKQILSMNAEQVELFIKEREVSEQLILAVFSFEPETYLDILKQLFAADTKEDVRNKFRTEVIHRRRREDPFDYFNHIQAMTDNELTATFIRNMSKGAPIACILPCLYNCRW